MPIKYLFAGTINQPHPGANSAKGPKNLVSTYFFKYVSVYFCYSDRNGEGVEHFLASDYVDVWQISLNHADVRVTRDFFYSKVYLDCVAIANVEDLVSEVESRTSLAKPDAEWFEDYVSLYTVHPT